MRLAVLLVLAGCAHRPAAPPPDVAALAATALDVTAMVVEVQAAEAGAVGCVVGPVVGAAARTGASFLRGSGALAGFTVDPSGCGFTTPSVALPDWLPVAVRGLFELVPTSAPPGVVAAVEYVAGASLALVAWARDTTQPIIVPGVQP